jgi:L-rhamnose isomerase
MRFRKDPDAVLDYTWDWSRWLQAGEAIVSHQILVPTGITLDSSDADAERVTAWLSGGTNGITYTVTCRITTDQGRTDDRSIAVWVLDR